MRYATEAALPVYILHQTLIVFAVYHLHDVDVPIGGKIVMTLTFALAGSLGFYEFVIRRSRLLRTLFGVKTPAREIGPEMSMLENKVAVLTRRFRAHSGSRPERRSAAAR